MRVEKWRAEKDKNGEEREHQEHVATETVCALLE